MFDAYLNETAVQSLQRDGIPFVCAGSLHCPGVDSVEVNVYPAVCEAVARLQKMGDRVAYLSPMVSEHAENHADQRFHAYHHQTIEAGRTVEIIHASDPDGLGDRAVVRESLIAHIKQHGHPDALFCFNDEMAIAAVATLRELKIRVPQDVAVVGFDGIEESVWHQPALSTVQYPYAQVAAETWRILQDRIANPDAPVQKIVLIPEVIWRDTSD